MEQMPDSSGAAPAEHAIPALPVRIVQVFVSPAKLFDALRERPAWIGALVGLMVLGIGAQLLLPIVVPEEVRRAMIETQMAQFAGADPAALEQQIETQMEQGPLWGSVSVIVVTPMFLALIAGLLVIAFSVVMGGEGRFSQLFSAAAHASYIGLAGGLLMIGLMATGAEQATLSPGLFLPDLEGFLGRFLNGINVFSVWTCGVLGVAVSRIYPGRTVAAGTTYLLVLYLLMVAGFAALGGLLGGLG
ncbi:YIP1 family protein [Candidatus Palauibacter sp.]|uniref:YIP1 family protein n=1 Tax=Candidatus Palauibacter sp. TaxID=3101350 RepID=UPI003AF2C590